MINYISVQYEQQLEGWRRRKGGEGGMFIVIRNGNVAAPMGRYDEVDKEYIGGNEPAVFTRNTRFKDEGAVTRSGSRQAVKRGVHVQNKIS